MRVPVSGIRRVPHAAAAGTGLESVVDKRRANRQGTPFSGYLPILERGVILDKFTPRHNQFWSVKQRQDNWNQQSAPSRHSSTMAEGAGSAAQLWIAGKYQPGKGEL